MICVGKLRLEKRKEEEKKGEERKEERRGEKRRDLFRVIGTIMKWRWGPRSFSG